MTAQTHMPAPLVIQEDRTILLDVDHPRYEELRGFVARFAELEQSLQHLQIYQLTRLSLWNAAAAGLQATALLDRLSTHSRYGLPEKVASWVVDTMGRYGLLVLLRQGEGLVLRSDDPDLLARLGRSRSLQDYLGEPCQEDRLPVRPGCRGLLKQRLRQLGYPPIDRAGYRPGAPLPLALRSTTASGQPLALRAYQQSAVDAFCGDGAHGGSGVVVLPCGAGKTVVGLAVMARLRCQTLILCPHNSAVRQWHRELLDKSSLDAQQIGEYTGERKEIAPVTLSTYQILTYRPSVIDPESGAETAFPHFALFGERDWGLILYDEVHLLPAPVFRVTADLQARRRLGLTATLVREDGRQGDVFSLIGPKVYEAPWRDLEAQGWLAAVTCREVRVAMSAKRRAAYARARRQRRARVAAENPAKTAVVARLVQTHADDQILVIGRYLRQLRRLARRLDAPAITGQTPLEERERLYRAFRQGEERLLVVSNVANFALDLPEAAVAIQVSGTYGSRQEEAQRLGRILRPKPGGRSAHFYTLVSQGTVEQEYATRRQRFLVEQGYRYLIVAGEKVVQKRRGCEG